MIPGASEISLVVYWLLLFFVAFLAVGIEGN